jgi:hypothetical protein
MSSPFLDCEAAMGSMARIRTDNGAPFAGTSLLGVSQIGREDIRIVRKVVRERGPIFARLRLLSSSLPLRRGHLGATR